MICSVYRIFTPHPDLETQDIKLSTDHITATFSKSTGLLKSVVSGDSEVRVTMLFLLRDVKRSPFPGGCEYGCGDIRYKEWEGP